MRDSTSSSLIRRFLALRQRAARDASGRFLIEGVRAFVEAHDAGLPLDTVAFSKRLLKNPVAQQVLRRVKRTGVPAVSVSPEQFRAISQLERASGVAAIARMRWTPQARAEPDAGLAWLAVGHVRSPGNLGTLIRTAEAVGAAGVLHLDDRTDPHDFRVIRASMGGFFHQRRVRASHAMLRAWASRGVAIVAAVTPGHSSAVPWHAHDFDRPTVLLLGNERSGLTEAERALATHAVTLPIEGRADSLNLGVAGAVLLYEALRQRVC